VGSMDEQAVESYETPQAVEVGSFIVATNGTNSNNNADDTEYYQ
jgi:hypothetical protein